MKRFEILEERCKGCCLCVGVCPKKILELGKKINKGGTQYILQTDEESCNKCGLCAIMCPDCAIEIYQDDEPTAKEADEWKSN